VDAEERLARLDAALERLREANQHAPMIVEGMRDAAALRELGFDGEIIIYNQEPGGLLDLADRLRTRVLVILLFDWDRKGGQLTKTMRENLAGSVKVEWEGRKELAIVSTVRCVEDLPSARRHLAKLIERREHELG